MEGTKHIAIDVFAEHEDMVSMGPFPVGPGPHHAVAKAIGGVEHVRKQVEDFWYVTNAESLRNIVDTDRDRRALQHEDVSER